MQYTHEHLEIQKTLKRFIDEEINPHVDEWEEAEIFPAHQVFKKLGKLGLLGLNKPEAYGGAGLDYSYAMAMAEALGHVDCGGVPMAIGVQTDMCTPALARFGSDALKREFLAPAIAGDMVGCIGVSEPGAGSDVAGHQEPRAQGRRRLPHHRPEDVDHQQPAGRLDVHAGQHRRRPGAPNKSLVMVPMDKLRPGIEKAKKIRKIGMNSSDTGPDLLRRTCACRSATASARRARASSTRCSSSRKSACGPRPAALRVADQLHRVDHRMGAGAQAVRRGAGRPAVGAVQAGRAEDRGGGAARADLPRLRPLCAGQDVPSSPRWPSSRPGG
jgi:hypothetical protein